MERDAGDIVDRWAIAKLKAERIGAEASRKEYAWFCEGLRDLESRYPKIDWRIYKQDILTIHTVIWDLESALRRGKLDNDLAEAGRRAIMIRDWNKKRVALKNTINAITGEGAQDIKQDHCSE